jgi:hypothetical protein
VNHCKYSPVPFIRQEKLKSSLAGYQRGGPDFFYSPLFLPFLPTDRAGEHKNPAKWFFEEKRRLAVARLNSYNTFT